MNLPAPDTANLKKRLFWYLLVIGVFSALYTVLFYLGMDYLEGEPVTIKQATQAVVEALTTAGFGGFAPWETWLMNLLVLVINITGVLTMFLGIPLFVVPMIHQALQPDLKTDYNQNNHVIICSSSRRDIVLRRELEQANVPYIIVDNNEDEVRSLQQDNIPAIAGNPESKNALTQANIGKARAVVADMYDKENVVIALSARNIAPDIQILASATEHNTVHYSKMAGVDSVVSVRQAMAISIARRAINAYPIQMLKHTNHSNAYQLTIGKNEQKDKQTVADLALPSQKNNFTAGWIDDRFYPSLSPGTELSSNSVIYTGHLPQKSLQEDGVKTHKVMQPSSPLSVVILGAGTTGRIAKQYLEARGVKVSMIDREKKNGATHTGDATNFKTLKEASIDQADAVLITLGADDTTIYAALAVDECTGEQTRIIARVNYEKNVWKVYNAGANFALSLQGVAGERFAQRILGLNDVVPPSAQFHFTKKNIQTGNQTVEEFVNHKEYTGVHAVVKNDGRTIFTPDPTHSLARGDTVVIVQVHTQYEIQPES